jgi:hypothetical protein
LGAAGCNPQASTPAGAGTQLQKAATRLDGETTFRLTLNTQVPPPSSPSPGPTDEPTAPVAGPPAPAPDPAPGTLTTVKMSGVWDTATGLSRMDGTLNAVATTVLTANGVQYVSLTPDVAKASGKKWLKNDNGDATFGDFADPHVVAQLLRAHHEVHAVAPDHLAGTVLTSEADGQIADPNLIASLSQYPSTLRFDVWTDGSGAPTEILFTLAGGGPVTTGTAKLDAFGTAAAQVSIPTIGEVVEGAVG